jgi:hypothetical protein
LASHPERDAVAEADAILQRVAGRIFAAFEIALEDVAAAKIEDESRVWRAIFGDRHFGSLAVTHRGGACERWQREEGGKRKNRCGFHAAHAREPRGEKGSGKCALLKSAIRDGAEPQPVLRRYSWRSAFTGSSRAAK